MKLAITGKGGAGKTTFTVFLSLFLAEFKKKVTVIDGDSTMNLPVAFGLPVDVIKAVTPLSEMDKLIEERTGAKPGVPGSFFKMNPKVDDISDKFALHVGDAIRLLVMGTIAKAGGGCACSENVFLRAFLTHLFIADEILILDMEAGIEHLGRGTIENVDTVLAIAEPDPCSIDVAQKILGMSRDLGIKNLKVIGSKVGSAEDKSYLKDCFPEDSIIGMVPFEPGLRRRGVVPSFAGIPESIRNEFAVIVKNLEKQKII